MNEGHTRDKVPQCKGNEKENPAFTVPLLCAGCGDGHAASGAQGGTVGQTDTQTQMPVVGTHRRLCFYCLGQDGEGF